MKANLCGFLSIYICLAAVPLVKAADTQPVTADNFVRAESDIAIKKIYDKVGLNKLLHNRNPTPIDKQNIIRMNRDTIYSFAVGDLSKPMTVTLPETDGRYMIVQVISQDHFSRVLVAPGSYEITQADVGTPYVYLFFRTFVNMADEKDIKAVNKLQDQVTLTGGGEGPLNLPNWDLNDANKVRDALLVLSSTLSDPSDYFGQPEQTTPVHHLIGAAMGWAGMAKENAKYFVGNPVQNDGKVAHSLTVKEVPVDAFWSITVYRADGYLEPNDRNVYAYNDRTAKPNSDGSYTINFGDCASGEENCLNIIKGWNYIFRMYEPRQEIIDGTWTVPPVKPIR